MTNVTSLLSSARRLMQCKFRCHLHCGRVYLMDTTGDRETPDYNYGLPGKGKTNKKIWKKHEWSKPAQPQGEVVFGIHPVTLALTACHRHRLHRLYLDVQHKQAQSSQSQTLNHIHSLAIEQNVPVEFVSRNVLMYLSGNRPHQRVCLDASKRELPDYNSQDLLQGMELNSDLLWLLLYNVQDPMNFGAVLRSAHFLGVDRMVVPKANSCAVSPVVSKASAGALEVMDMVQIDGSYRSIKQLTQTWQSIGGQVVGTASMSDSCGPVCSVQDFTVSAPTLLIVGNEGSGVDADVLDLCDVLLTIPSPVSQACDLHVQSLNVSVATGILIHWLRTSRRTL